MLPTGPSEINSLGQALVLELSFAFSETLSAF